jgi:hypothetical protein
LPRASSTEFLTVTRWVLLLARVLKLRTCCWCSVQYPSEALVWERRI